MLLTPPQTFLATLPWQIQRWAYGQSQTNTDPGDNPRASVWAELSVGRCPVWCCWVQTGNYYRGSRTMRRTPTLSLTFWVTGTNRWDALLNLSLFGVVPVTCTQRVPTCFNYLKKCLVSPNTYIHTHMWIIFFLKIQINTTVFCALLSIQGRSRVNTHFPCPAADILLSTLEARISGCIKGDRGSRGVREYLASSLENINGPEDSGEVRLSASMLSKKMLDLFPMRHTAHWLDSVAKIYKAHKHGKTIWTNTPWIFGPKNWPSLNLETFQKGNVNWYFHCWLLKFLTY